MPPRDSVAGGIRRFSASLRGCGQTLSPAQGEDCGCLTILLSDSFGFRGRLPCMGGTRSGHRSWTECVPVSSPSRILATQSHTQSGRSGRGDALRLARGIRRRNKPKTIPHSPAAHGRASGEATSRRSGRLCVPSVFHPHPANPVILSRQQCPPRNIAPHAERTAKGEAPPAGILSSGGDDKFWSHPLRKTFLTPLRRLCYLEFAGFPVSGIVFPTSQPIDTRSFR